MKRMASPEHIMQVTLLGVLEYALRPDIYVFAIPNAARRSYRTASYMSAEGMKAGISDLCFMCPIVEGAVAWLEMKAPGKTLKVEQHGFKAICARLGHRWAMAQSVEEAFEIVRGWNLLKPKAVIL